MSGPEPAHYSDLAAVDDAAWAMLAEGAADRRAAFHQVQVASVARDGRPEVRTVVLRKVDCSARCLGFHTDVRSAKFAALTACPDVELHAYDHAAKVQVRARGRAVLHHCDATTAALWAAMRTHARAVYAQPPAPGTALGAPGGAGGPPLDDAAAFANFVLVDVRLAEVEWVYLAATGHRRARLCYFPEKMATWVAP